VRPAVTDSNSSYGTTHGTTSRNRIFFVLIAVLSLAGITVSGIALQRHYARSATQFCEIGEKFNCDIVNRSEYSTVAGIPVSGIGVAGYALLFALATLYRSRVETPIRLVVAAIGGLVFALYLTYIEAYMLTTWCILCLTSLLLIFLITVLAITVKFRT
jgi:vitamin-K-epoxide reductase (warfarin-sensitive)